MCNEILDSPPSNLYGQIIKYWERQIGAYKLQGKIHEIAEIYLKVSDVYEKLGNYKLNYKNVLNSINYLREECKILKDFNDTRNLVQNFQNIAELYFRINKYKDAKKYYNDVIKLAKEFRYLDLLAYSYQQTFSCYKELDEINESTDLILDGIEYFLDLYNEFEEKNDNLAISQVAQILKNLYQLIDDEEQFIYFSKKEAGAFINLAERLEKCEENFPRIAQFYRGAGLSYQLINNNLIESASCFVLAGNYSEKIENYDDAASNFYNAALTFKEMGKLEKSYQYYIKAGDNYWKLEEVNDSTECFLTAYDIAVEVGFEYNQFGLFNQIIRGLNIIAKEGLKNKQFYTAATLILESIKFYQQLDIAKDFLVNEMVRNVYKYYYRAANLKKIGTSHVVQSYILAALSSILNGKIEKALEILSEIEFEGNTINKYKRFVELIINWVKDGKQVEFESLPFEIQRIINDSEEIMYLLRLFKGFKIPA